MTADFARDGQQSLAFATLCLRGIFKLGLILYEAVVLTKEDVVLEDDMPVIRLQAHSWRSLKTINSEKEAAYLQLGRLYGA